jgi:hypothetical protein
MPSFEILCEPDGCNELVILWVRIQGLRLEVDGFTSLIYVAL